jgi:hypothetical protein
VSGESGSGTSSKGSVGSVVSVGSFGLFAEGKGPTYPLRTPSLESENSPPPENDPEKDQDEGLAQRSGPEEEEENKLSPPLTAKLVLDWSWTCPVCEDPVTDDTDGVACEACDTWFHLACAGFASVEDLPQGDWLCKCCRGQ